MTIEQVKQQLESAVAAYRAKAAEKESVWRPLSAKVKALQAELQAALTEGANPCASCGGPALGLERTKSISPTAQIQFFEIGCAGVCAVRGKSPAQVDGTREGAIAKWNEKNPLPQVH